jgi:hypothetical protein
VYSRCIFCQAELGRNESIEHFPVGRRLAFDAAKGRLWVVCRKCERWNLTPLEERWEAIEECERAFRDSRLRVATDNIGLARLRDGLELVRIGEPLRPEMAAWRYGDQFGRRRRRFLVATTVACALPLSITAAQVFGPATLSIAGSLSLTAVSVGSSLFNRRTVARVRTPDRVVRLDAMAVRDVALRPSRDHWWELDVPVGPRERPGFWRRLGDRPVVALHGDAALAAARVILPKLNQAGGKPAVVRDAVARLESDTDISLAFARAAVAGAMRTGYLKHLPGPQVLALEMALHEADERRALDGELAELEQRWRDAEAIAAISDALLVPESVTAAIARARTDA